MKLLERKLLKVVSSADGTPHPIPKRCTSFTVQVSPFTVAADYASVSETSGLATNNDKHRVGGTGAGAGAPGVPMVFPADAFNGTLHLNSSAATPGVTVVLSFYAE